MRQQRRCRQEHKRGQPWQVVPQLPPPAILPIYIPQQHDGPRRRQREAHRVHACLLAFCQPEGRARSHECRQQAPGESKPPGQRTAGQRKKEGNAADAPKHAKQPAEQRQLGGRLAHGHPKQAVPAVQQPVINGGLNIQFGRSGNLQKRPQRHVDIAGLVPPDVLAGKLLQAHAKGKQQQGQQPHPQP